MREISFFGTVTAGKFQPEEPQRFREAFIAHNNKRITITVKRFHRPRSNQQNKYYWGVVLEIISEYTGYSPEEVHEMMRAKFLSHVLKMKIKRRAKAAKELHAKRKNKKPIPKAIWIRVSKSTTDLTTVQFEKYLEKIKRFAATKLDGLYIPDPEKAMVAL